MGACWSAPPLETTPLISTERELPVSYRARVLHVTDAQNFIVQPVHADFTLRIMLHGVSIPRVRTRHLPDKEAAIRARVYVRQKIENEIVELKRLSLHTYRVLTLDGVDLAQDMLFRGLVNHPTIREMV